MIRSIDRLRDTPFDLLIIGGGITGAGVALDASLRGFNVALIDKGDFASGTSSVSSKLVHGGLRYLEHGSIRLVYEALHERRLLLTNAPHLVHPLRFVIPFYQGSRVPSWKWRVGLSLYDFLAGKSNLNRSRPLSTSQIGAGFPRLNEVGLYGGAAYFDAQMDDARLCLAVLQTSASQGACVANYVEAVGVEKSGGIIKGVRALDKIEGGEFSIRARLVLNAAGPWVDSVCRLAGDEAGPYLQPTKGIHLIVPNQGMSSAVLLLHPADGRVFFVLPWQGRTLIGTTDTLCKESPDQLQVTDADISYLLAAFNHHFKPGLTESDVINHFVGVRPLLHARTNDPSSLSREFRVWTSASGLISVAGGKYTTYRAMAEAVTDDAVKRLGKRGSCKTRKCKLEGTPDEPWSHFERSEPERLVQHFAVSHDVASHLVQRYGSRAEEVATYLSKDGSLAQAVMPGEPDLRAEFAYQRDQEMALLPPDFLLRRTRLGLFHPELLQVGSVDLAASLRRAPTPRSPEARG